MKLNKRLLSILLVVVMVIGMFPVAASAEDQGQTLCEVCQSAEHLTADHPVEDLPEVCGICNSAEHTTDAHPVTNSLDDEPEDLCPNCDDAQCTGCEGTDTQEEKEEESSDPVCTGDPATCQVTDCACKQPKTEEPLCDKCNATKTAEGAVKHEPTCEKVQPEALCGQCKAVRLEDGTISHEETCPTLKKDVPSQPTILCDKCGTTEKNGDGTVKHAEDCETLKPAVLCDKCGTTEKNEDGTPKHAEDCETLKPAVLCDKCNATEKNEDGTVKHAEDCETLCTCTPTDGVHQPYCVLYVAPEEVTKEAVVSDVTIQVTGNIPDEVTLSAAYVPERKLFRFNKNQSTDVVFNNDIYDVIGAMSTVAFAFDITLANEDGTSWQPAEGETVSVTLDVSAFEFEDGTRLGIAHDHEGVITKLGEYAVEDGKLTFETTGFSVFYGFTVDFEYDGEWHSIAGGSSIFLYELFAQLGIDRSTSSVTDVTFSDPSLVEVTLEVVDGYTGRKDWYLRSLEPFTTEEALWIEFSDGSEIVIKVYDATYSALSNNLTLNNGDIINGATISGNVTVTLNGTVTINQPIVIRSGNSLTVNGSGTFKRGASCLVNMFQVTGGSLTINNGITIDGGASWTSVEVANSTREKLTVTSRSDVTSSAIYVNEFGGTVNLNSVTFKNLYTKSQAAAIHATGKTDDAIHSTVNMTNVTVQNCATMSGNSIVLFNDCIANLTGCQFIDNFSGGTYAGAIKAGGPNYFSQLNMTNCTASRNYSSGWGGVILWAANNSCNGKTSKATINGCNFTNNKARYLGGAISNEAIMEVSNTTITDNIAMAGGGIATFPFTLTETQEGGGNACGLTLSSGNTIKNNLAFASGDFTPFLYQDVDTNGTIVRNKVEVKTYNINPVISDDTAISNPITYIGGGGGVWCYMNKPGWTCSLNIGSGNEILSNTANNVGGGVHVDNVASAGTELKISGAKISGNNAVNGGGVAVTDATVSIDSGEISNNIASVNGGGIYVDNGICTVSGTGSVSNNTAGKKLSTDGAETITGGNGGGIYIDSGSLSVSGGVISQNNAVGNTQVDTAKNSDCGVGGGIYVNAGGFSMSGDNVGLHSNIATVAANDAYATGGTATTLKLPNVENMNLAGWSGTGKPEGWFADYVADDSYYPQDVIGKANRGRYDFYDEDKVEVEYNNLASHENTYYCLTIGTPHPGYGQLTIRKELPDGETAPENQTYIFHISGTTRQPVTNYSMTVTLTIKKGESSAEVLVANIPDGTYSVTEQDAWSWRYDFEVNVVKSGEEQKDSSSSTESNDFTVAIEDPAWTAIFRNKYDEEKWLSGDCYVENWWNNGAITKR